MEAAAEVDVSSRVNKMTHLKQCNEIIEFNKGKQMNKRKFANNPSQ